MRKGDKSYSLFLTSTAFLLLLIIISSIELVATAHSDLSAEYAYVPNEKSNTVSVINTTTDAVISTVPVGNVPVGVAISLDGTKVYVTNFGNDDIPGRTVSIIDTATEEVTSMNVEEGKPGKPAGVAIYPYEQKVYVAKLLNGKVRAVDLITNKASDIPVGTDPCGIAITPDGSRIYVANTGSNTISVINTVTNNVTKTVNVGVKPYGVAVNKNGTKVYVTNMESSNVSVINTITNEVTDNLTAGKDPHGIAVTPDEKWVYVANHNTPMGTVSVINTTTKDVTNITVGKNPCGVAVNKNGTKIYVTNSGTTDDLGGTVSVIDTETKTVMGQPISVGIRPSGLGQFIGSVPGSRVETMTTLTSSPNRFLVGESRTLTATVSATSQVTEKPSGTVTFMEGATSIGTETLSDGQAILDTSLLSNGSHSIIARYKGNNQFRPSTSSSFTLIGQDLSSKKSVLEHPIVAGIIIAVVSGIISLGLYIIKKKYFS